MLVMDTDLRRAGRARAARAATWPRPRRCADRRGDARRRARRASRYHLTVLRAGRTYDRPAEMLGSAPMRRLVDTLRAQFDRIVVDSAPAIVADPGAVAPLADGLLLVVRAGTTTKPAIARAIGTLGATKLLGLVFNESGAPQQKQYAASA